MTIRPSHHATPGDELHDARLIALGEQLEEIRSKLRPVAVAQVPAIGWSPFGYHCSGGDMELTEREREVVLAFCQKKAQECRDRASRISPDLREYAEQTARMWEEIAASVVGTGTLDELLASAGKQKQT
jgi:hypothetical protein